MANSILWGNTPDQVTNCPACPLTVLSYSLVQGGCPPSATCPGNLITGDPRFRREPDRGADGSWGTVDDDYGDLRLHVTSPAIDAGDNDAVPADTLDIDSDGNIAEKLPYAITAFVGAPRFLDVQLVADTGAGTAPIVDMGPFELESYAVCLPSVVRNH